MDGFYKNWFSAVFGICAGYIIDLFGGWSASLTTLIIFMVIDYITGIIQAILGKSLKSENGKLNSKVGFKGISKKVLMLLMVVVGRRIDITFNITYVREMIILSYIMNEFISIIENLSTLGIEKLPIFDKIVLLIKSEVNKNNERE